MASKKTNNILWILHGVGLCLWVACFFLGFAYQAETVISIPVSLAVGGLMFLFVLGMYKQKIKRTHEPQDKLFDLLFKIFYGVTSLVSFVFILHFIFITTVEQGNIRYAAKDQYDELKLIFDDDNLNGYLESHVNYRIKVLEKSLIANHTPQSEIDNEIELRKTEFEDDYFIMKDYFTKSSFNKEKGKLDNIIWLDDVQYLLNNLYETEEYCLNGLVESSQRIDPEQSYKPMVNSNSENLRTRLKFDFKKINSTSIIYGTLLSLIFQSLILLVYFVAERGDRSFKGKKIDGISSL